MTGFYDNAPVYDPAAETFLDLVWRYHRGQATSEEVRKYILSRLDASLVDLYDPLTALLRLGYSQAKAERMLRDEDLEELL